MTPVRWTKWKNLVAVGTLSASMLAFELTLTRLFALAQFYHFAFMAISLALLGGGAAGTLLTIWPRLGKRPGWWSAGFSAGVLVSFAILRLVPFDSYAIAWQPVQILYLVLTFAGALLPFLCSGLVVGGLLAADSGGLHRVYAANLAGSALGSVGVLPLLIAFGGEGTLFVCAALGLAASALFTGGSENGRKIGRRQRSVWGGVGITSGILVLTGIIALRPGWSQVELSPYKALTLQRLTPDAEHTVTKWGAAVRVDVVESSAIHVMPGLSPNAVFSQPPRQAGLTLDGDNLAPITALSPDDDLAHLLASSVPLAIAQEVVPDADNVLILYPGAGWDVLMMLAADEDRSLDTGSVTVLEQHPVVIDVLRGPYGDYTYGLLDDPRVRVLAELGRTFLRRDQRQYDVINMALSDSFHPVTAGAFTLTEDYRYTVEAIGDALSRLSPGGMLIVTRWLQTPPTESLRLLATIEAALARQGVTHPGHHIAAFRSMRTMSFVVSPTPLTTGQHEQIRKFAASRGYDLVWLSGISLEETNRFNRLPQPVYYDHFRALLADPSDFVSTYPYDVRPTTDSRPFFFHYFRWRQTPQIMQELGHTWQPFGGSGYLVLIALLILVAIFATVLIVLPLFAARRGAALKAIAPRLRWRSLVYFAMLGLGFLFIEIPLAQQFILSIGHPTTALAVVIFTVLLFSGLGSLTAHRWPLRWALAALIVVAVIMPFILRAVFALSLGWGETVRIAVAIVVLAPLGLLMGIPFARGLSILEDTAPGLTPWAWAVNGSVSVVSAILAMMMALSWGFPLVLWIGAATYAVALASIWKLADPTRHEHPA